MANSSPSTSGIGWFTGLILSLVISSCLILIGFSGYLKYQLDRAEAVLAAPESAITGEQDATLKLRRALGYSGFISAAQTFTSTHDQAAVNDMKAQVKTAKDIIDQLPQRTPPEARRDLQSIVEIFATVAQKAEQSATDTAVGFTNNDLSPLYAALPVLNQRAESVMAAGRFTAQANLKLWATLLTLIAWVSLVTAAACAAGIYLSLRQRHAAPLRALAQSVQNMGRGDMRTPIWGMERQDIVGDLARSIDLARYHFSQLPDMSLLSDQGPMRIKFEGKARSLFEAMVQSITRDSEGIRAQATTLADSVNQQKEAIATIANRLIAEFGQMQEERQSKDQKVHQALNSVIGTANSLKGTQDAAQVQLNHLISYLEERAKGMAEVTQIAGKQVAQTLQSLTSTEHNLRSSAEQNQETVKKLAASTDELGERLFGAVSLLRAGGKVLTETAENTQSRLNEAISLLSQSEGSLRHMLVQGFEPVGNPLLQAPAREEEKKLMQSIVSGLETAQRKIEECLSRQTNAANAQIEQLTAHSKNLLSQAGNTAEALVTALDNIGGRLEQRVAESLGRAENTMQGFDRLSELMEGMGTAVERLNGLEPALHNAATTTAGTTSNVLMEIKSGFEVTTRSIARLREEFITSALDRPAAPASFEQAALVDTTAWDKLLEQVVTANGSLTKAITEQTDRVENRLASMDKKMASAMSPDEAQTQLQQQAQVLSELATALGAIDAHMQEMRAAFKNYSQAPSNNGRMAS